MSENEISGKIIDIYYHVHVGLGPGLLESIYEKIIAYELTQKGLAFVQQQPIPVFWKGVKIDIGFRADLIVENKVLVELKSVEKIAAVHQKQVMSYLKLTGLKLGLLINFNEALIKNGITRIAHNL